MPKRQGLAPGWTSSITTCLKTGLSSEQHDVQLHSSFNRPCVHVTPSSMKHTYLATLTAAIREDWLKHMAVHSPSPGMQLQIIIYYLISKC